VVFQIVPHIYSIGENVLFDQFKFERDQQLNIEKKESGFLLTAKTFSI